jgi:hypothetical protein
MKASQTIKGSDYLAFLADPAYWRPAAHADTQGVHVENVALIVDGHHLHDDEAKPEAIAPDSTVAILFGDVFEHFERLHTLQEHYESWATKRAELAALKQRHDEYLANLRAQGVTLLSYVVPCCGAKLEAPAASEGGRWTSLATCPECGGMFMQITTADKIEALRPNGEKA